MFRSRTSNLRHILQLKFMMNRFSNSRNNILKLKDEYYKPRDLSEDDELENIVDAILKQKAMAMDAGYVADVVKNFYRFRNDEQKHVGTDVLALDILRGRDHGLNSYIKYLELCTGDQSIVNWTDLLQYINAEVKAIISFFFFLFSKYFKHFAFV